MLDDIRSLGWQLRNEWNDLLNGVAVWDGMYCPECGGNRRMSVHLGHVDSSRSPSPFGGVRDYQEEKLLETIAESAPILLDFKCVQCDARFTVLIYAKSRAASWDNAEDPELAIFPKGRGSLSTPNTPESVQYYLDQVQLCWSVGANSAAISMYRVALDHLLFGEGFTKGMVGKKLEALETAIANGSAPKWATDLDPMYLGVLNKLATYALHPNDGDVQKQSVFDQDLLVAVKATFQSLLFGVYELPLQEQARLRTLEPALNNLQ